MMTTSEKVTFTNKDGLQLDGVLETPGGRIHEYALYAHCFTCSKEIAAAVRVSRALASRGIATLRFDFSGLGRSEGDFADTTFSSDIADIHAAADFLRKKYQAPTLLIGHSLGGAAVLGAADGIEEVKALATIGAPSTPEHVKHLFDHEIEKITMQGKACVDLAGRKIIISKAFMDDILQYDLKKKVANLKKALLILHSPIDNIVGIENAQELYQAAKHPKSFISLDNADHLLAKKADAEYAAQIIAAWAERYTTTEIETNTIADAKPGEVIVEETGTNKFARNINAAGHILLADEPVEVGGSNTGAAPYDLLLSALGACVSMTVRMFADHKGWPLEKVHVRLKHYKTHAADCEQCETKEGKIDRIEKFLRFEGNLTDEQRARLLEISERCPVNRTLQSEIVIITTEEKASLDNVA